MTATRRIHGKRIDRTKVVDRYLPTRSTGDEWHDIALIVMNAGWQYVCDPPTCPAGRHCEISRRRRAGDDTLMPRDEAARECFGALYRWAVWVRGGLDD